MTPTRKGRKGQVCKCDQAPDPMLMKTFGDTISAGDKLSEASHRVQADHDGVHRLRLALSNWYTTRANEFNRDEAVDKKGGKAK